MHAHWLTNLVVLISSCGAAVPPPPATAPTGTSDESKPVEQGGVSVTARVKPGVVRADEQPRVIVRFSNAVTDYINLYGIDAYWDWRIRFTNLEGNEAIDGSWRMRMKSIPLRLPVAVRQIKAGEVAEVLVDLNDPPFTFDYVHEGAADRPVGPVRHLPPGLYRVEIKISMQNPVGQPGYHYWTGPLTTTPVELKVSAADVPARQPTPTEIAAFDNVIDRVTGRLNRQLWLNGHAPLIKLAPEAAPEDVVDAAVNESTFGTKAYRIERVRREERLGPNVVAGLVRVGEKPQVLLFFPLGNGQWWTRFYDPDAFPPR